MLRRDPSGQANLTTTLLVIALIVTGVWVWKRLPPETQEYLVERAIPASALTALGLIVVGVGIRAIRRRRETRRERARLLARFEAEGSPEKRRELAFALIELNQYKREGLDRVAPAMADLLMTTLKTAVGDKQHRIRGMAASHLGVLQEKAAIPPLLAALEDDHAYVRACAALALGRMRAGEAKEKLTQMMEEDWDQTVRSRAREALERMT
jgi:HEAT repeat protein